jgi:hypothetical protein
VDPAYSRTGAAGTGCPPWPVRLSPLTLTTPRDRPALRSVDGVGTSCRGPGEGALGHPARRNVPGVGWDAGGRSARKPPRAPAGRVRAQSPHAGARGMAHPLDRPRTLTRVDDEAGSFGRRHSDVGDPKTVRRQEAGSYERHQLEKGCRPCRAGTGGGVRVLPRRSRRLRGGACSPFSPARALSWGRLASRPRLLVAPSASVPGEDPPVGPPRSGQGEQPPTG